MDSSFREEILPMEMEEEDSVYMERHSMMRTLKEDMHVLDYSVWPIEEEILIVVNSSSLSKHVLT